MQGDRSNTLVGSQAINQYEQDFYAWTQEQSKLLRLGQWQGLDIENMVEEILALGRQQKQELRNQLGILIGHLLKWDYQPDMRSPKSSICNSHLHNLYRDIGSAPERGRFLTNQNI